MMEPNNDICEFPSVPWVMDTGDEMFAQKVIPLVAMNILLSISTTILNTLAIKGLWNLETIPHGTKALLLNLPIADLLTGLVAGPLYTVFLALQLRGKTVCSLALAYDIIGVVLWLSSFSTVVAATFERFVSIFHPYFHERLILGSKPRIIVISIWAASIMFRSLFEINENTVKSLNLTLSGLNILGCCCIVCSYTRIFSFACQVRRGIEAQERGFQSQRSSLSRAQIRNSTYTVAAIAMLSICCYLPLTVFRCMRYVYFPNAKLDNHIGECLWVLMLANSALNPALYCLTNTTVREAIFRVWRIK